MFRSAYKRAHCPAGEFAFFPGLSLVLVTALVLLIACHSRPADPKPVAAVKDSCANIKDTFQTVSVFGLADTMLPNKSLRKVIQFIESKGDLRLKSVDEKWKDIWLPHYIDTCVNKTVTQYFILQNVTAITCLFKSTTPMKQERDYYPRFELTQWNFASNADRDSALKIMNRVYSHRGGLESEVHYKETVIGDKSLYMIEPRARIFWETAQEYAGYLKNFLIRPEMQEP